MKSFKAIIEIIGINPFVSIPKAILENLFQLADKEKSPIPVKGFLDGFDFQQTLVKYKGIWRLYINTPILKKTGKHVGDTIHVSVTYDDKERIILMHPKLEEALLRNAVAKQMFESAPPYLQKEIKRYFQHLKSEAAIDRNITLAIQFLTSNQRWIGRNGLMP